MRYWIGSLLTLVLFSGCVTTPSTTSGPLIGRELTFTTVEPAPEDIDAFTFFWTYPSLEHFDTQVVRIIVLANGEEYVADDDATGALGQYVRSDTSPGVAPHTPSQFRGKHITTIFRSQNGRIRIPRDFCSYAFHKKDKNGKINWRQPYKEGKAKVSIK